MSSKRAIRRKACDGKHRYDNQDEAIGAIRRLRKNTGTVDRLLPYKCKFCKGFHFGHVPGQIKAYVK